MGIRWMGRGAVACTLAFAIAPVLAQNAHAPAMESAATAGAIVQTEDVDLFYRVYDNADGRPTA